MRAAAWRYSTNNLGTPYAGVATRTQRQRRVEYARRRPPQGDVELMAQKQIFSLEPAPRLEQIGDEHCQQMEDRKHHVE